MAKRKRKSPFVIDENDKLFVDIKYCGIHFFVICCDCLSIYSWPGDKRRFLSAEDAVQWHKNELAETRGQSGSQQAVDDLTKAIESVRAGKFIIQDRAASRA